MNRRLAMLLAWAATTAAVAGCGDGGPPAATVSGEVKANGVPIEKGVIAFSSLDGTGAAVTVDIKGGKYEVRTTAGKKRVQISAPVVTGKRKESPAKDAPMVDVIGESLPEKFHSQSTLELDVQPGGNTKDWLLEFRKK